ncbi:lipopolysaccharide kinase InaA family protein [Desulfoluna sp.]|uniref:lipopolysaccharide kinase InaA family protein n=1 Tax=Desulfoluna sp. TaxID=2045199 RepID=UPI00260F805B|nr:lipopolysaccharide kinase InaA family protein [Desulfoluna sp.]
MKIGPYTLTSHLPLTQTEGIYLTAALPATLIKGQKTLGGRGALQFIDGISGKHVAIKPYLRGGLVGRVNRRYYLERGKTRAFKEYELLVKLSGTEVKTPTPLGVIESGRFIRCCWLLMETLPHDHTLATAPLTPQEQDILFSKLAPQMSALLDRGLHHVDLHPGNIIVTKEGHPVLIDFDKAREGINNRKALSTLYVKRWIRAVKKHRLPDALSESFVRMMKSL